MFRDFLDLIALLNKYEAKYLVIGGYAVGFHAQARATKDLDIFILPDPANAKAVFAALQEFGAPLRTKCDPQDADSAAPRRRLTAKDFEDAANWFMMGTPPVAVDLLASIPGVTFDIAWKNRIEVTLDDGITAQVISRDDLIAAKLASGRMQDLADVDAIRQASVAAQQKSVRGKPEKPDSSAKPKRKPKNPDAQP
jgi:hypothetical protein